MANTLFQLILQLLLVGIIFGGLFAAFVFYVIYCYEVHEWLESRRQRRKEKAAR